MGRPFGPWKGDFGGRKRTLQFIEELEAGKSERTSPAWMHLVT
jgi:hypothetical protein